MPLRRPPVVCLSLSSYMCRDHLLRFSKKAFHTSSRRQFLDTCLSETHGLIIGLHAFTGLPWAATLPLTALLVRSVLIAPVTTYVHITNRRRLEHQPLIQAWTHVFRDEVMKDHAVEGPVKCQKLVRKKLLQKSAEIYRGAGTQLWKSFLGYLQIPVWLTLIETIRRMCGNREGLLGMIQSMFFGSNQVATVPSEQESKAEVALSEPISSIDDLQVASPDGLDVLESISPDGLDVLESIGKDPLIPLESSLATEGALWFHNLLLPDPHLALSFILSGSLLANIFYQERRAKKRGWEPSAMQRGFGNFFKIAALAVGPLTLSFPSAIHLYLISSSVSGLANTVLLNHYLPITTTSQPQTMKASELEQQETAIKWAGQAKQIHKIRKRRDPRRHRA
ncbi:MAG: hypothetical protein Q9184_007720 [Pyrenodesmia sp. 2 TL-2023]